MDFNIKKRELISVSVSIVVQIDWTSGDCWAMVEVCMCVFMFPGSLSWEVYML